MDGIVQQDDYNCGMAVAMHIALLEDLTQAGDKELDTKMFTQRCAQYSGKDGLGQLTTATQSPASKAKIEEMRKAQQSKKNQAVCVKLGTDTAVMPSQQGLWAVRGNY